MPAADLASVLLGTTIFLTAPVAYASLGVLWSELSGVYNFGIEGIMLLGAISGFLGVIFTGSLLIGLVLGIIVGLGLGILVALMSVTLKVDQIILAVGLLTIAPSLSAYLFTSQSGIGLASTTGVGHINTFPYVSIPFLGDLPVLGAIFNQPLIVYSVFILAGLTHYFFYYTKTGLKFRAVGMNPMAADSMGVNVFRIRYVALAVSGILGALGGITIVMGQTGFWGDNLTAGRGLVAVALLRLGNWKTNIVLLSAVLFGFLSALAFYLQSSLSTGGLVTNYYPYEGFSIVPYAAAIAVIALSFKWRRSAQPKSLGKPYRRG